LKEEKEDREILKTLTRLKEEPVRKLKVG
jgi:hypothetical protein